MANYPFTMIKPMMPVDNLSQKRDLKMITVNGQRTPLLKVFEISLSIIFSWSLSHIGNG